MPMPTYETIPPHPMDGATLQFLEKPHRGYNVHFQKEITTIPETGVAQETSHKDDSEGRYSKLQLTAKK